MHEEDPRDPQVILARLPAREREFFLQRYREKAQAAVDDVAGFKQLQAFLHHYSLVAVATNKPGYYEAIEEAKAGTGVTYPIEEVIAERLGLTRDEAEAYWAERVDAARERRHAL